jgi:hypothetical protein
MTIDNSKTIISFRIKLFAATVIFLAFMILTYIARMITYPLLGLSETVWTVALVVIYLIYAFMPMILNYQYISYSDEDDKIVFRYFNSGFTGGRKNSIEIYKSEFAGFKTGSQLFGLKKSITLFHKLPGGIAKYPPVWLSALKKPERERIIAALMKLSPGN